jgi:hypothetical protein
VWGHVWCLSWKFSNRLHRNIAGYNAAKYHLIDLLQIRAVGCAVMWCSFLCCCRIRIFMVSASCDTRSPVNWQMNWTRGGLPQKLCWVWITNRNKMKSYVQGCARSGQRVQIYPRVITLTRLTFSFKGKRIRRFLGDSSRIAGDARPVARNKNSRYDISRGTGAVTGL